MPSIQDNITAWSNYDWPQQGDEWSKTWGRTEFLWWGTLYPRIAAFLPTSTILEIAPGFGRFTHFLKDMCDHLVVVDVTERCITACQERFATATNITYHLNDGKSLAMIPDRSIDFVFSFDSLVHAEADVLQVYLNQLAKKLKPNGVGLIHHSNIGAYRDQETGQLPFKNAHSRGESMKAQLFEEYCREAGLQCITQELINWGTDPSQLIDSFSLFTLPGSPFARANSIFKNPDFMAEAAYLANLSNFYYFNPISSSAQPKATPPANRISQETGFAQPPAGLSSLTNQINQARQTQRHLVEQPVIGQFAALKQLFYKLSHSTFSRQFNFNNIVLDLLETLSHKFDDTQRVSNQQLMDLQHQLMQLRGQLEIIRQESTNGKLEDLTR